MKKTDMELQAIREKLLQLQAEPATGEVLSAPWSSSQHVSQASSKVWSEARSEIRSEAQSEVTYRQRLSSQPPKTTLESPQAAAIQTLRERSNSPSSPSARSATVNAQAESMVALELDRLQVLAGNINERSQQQASEILAMKRSAQQAAVALRRQGIHNHPDLHIIEQFLSAYPSASVPLLERDSRGQFCLNHSVVDLHQAEQEASNIAHALRSRRTGGHSSENFSEKESMSYGNDSILFSEPVEQSLKAGLETEHSERFAERRVGSTRSRRSKGGLKKLLFSLKKTFQRPHKRGAAANAFVSAAGQGMESSFSWTDAAIWFSGAAIARIVLEAVVTSVPLLHMPILLILFSAISFSIYRVVVAKSIHMPSVYRLAITLLGLIVGGSL